MRSFAGAIILITLSGCATNVLAQSASERSSGQDSALTPRVERLEEQLVDLQGVVAAVETLAKNGSGAAAPSYPSSSGGASSDQLRQLSDQIADLTQRLERLEARFGSAAPLPSQQRSQIGLATPPASGFDDKQQLPALTSPEPVPDRFAAGGASQPPRQPYGDGAEPKPTLPRTANIEPEASGGSLAAASTGGDARTLFDQAYSALNRREYSASETYFEQFLQQYPSDPLAGSAQFWFGEAAFVSGEYRSAADRFLKAFTNYPSSEKAPEALLKLAISLRRLGENNAACESFAELQRRFPQPPKTIAQRAESERRRANCT